MKTSTKALTGVILCTVLVVSFLLLPSFIPSTGIDVPFEEIDKWWISGYESRDNLTIRDDETWETLWTEMESIHSHPADLHKTNITRIIMTNAYYVVYVDEIHPGETCILLAVMTYPYHIVKISDLPLNLPVQFVYNIIIHDCG
jgi:hypothetical protein